MAGMGQAFFDPTSLAAAQHLPCYSSSSQYAPFAQTNPHGSFGQQAATPPSRFLQTSDPPLYPTHQAALSPSINSHTAGHSSQPHRTALQPSDPQSPAHIFPPYHQAPGPANPHQSAFLDWTAPPPPPGEGAISQLPSTNLFPHMHGAGGNPHVAIKQEETEYETGFMPGPHHAAGRPEHPSSLGCSAGACHPSLLATDAHMARMQQGGVAELNGLLHGDSGISAGSQTLLDMDLDSKVAPQQAG